MDLAARRKMLETPEKVGLGLRSWDEDSDGPTPPAPKGWVWEIDLENGMMLLTKATKLRDPRVDPRDGDSLHGKDNLPPAPKGLVWAYSAMEDESYLMEPEMAKSPIYEIVRPASA